MNGREKIIRIFAFLGGIYFVLYFLLPEKTLAAIGITTIHEGISYGFILVGAAAFGVGIINLCMVHGSRIIYLKKDWVFSGALLFGLFAMLALSVTDWRNDLRIASEAKKLDVVSLYARKLIDEKKDNGSIEETKKALLFKTLSDSLMSVSLVLPQDDPDLNKLLKLREIDEGIISTINGIQQRYADELQKRKEMGLSFHLFNLLNQSFFVALGSAMFSLLGVYIAAAAYRAFRIKNIEAALMMSAAVLVMLGQIPFGVWISPHLPEIRLWLLQVPNGAAFRAIRLGAAVAGLILALRMWLSIERAKT